MRIVLRISVVLCKRGTIEDEIDVERGGEEVAEGVDECTQPMISQKVTHERLDVLFTIGPKSQGTGKNKLLLLKEGKKKITERYLYGLLWCG